MKVTEITYGKKFNIGDYESEEFRVTAALDEGEEVGDAFNELKTVVHNTQAGTPASGVSIGNILNNNGFKNPKTGQGQKSKISTPAQKETQNVSSTETSNEEDSNEEVTGEENEENTTGKRSKLNKDADEASAKTSKKGAKAGSKKRSKATTYDRLNDLHKQIISDMLDEEMEGWNEDKARVKAIKSASGIMVGEDFLNDEGEMLPGFMSKFMKYARKG